MVSKKTVRSAPRPSPRLTPGACSRPLCYPNKSRQIRARAIRTGAVTESHALPVSDGLSAVRRTRPRCQHLLPVTQAQATEEAVMAGVLHDLVENTRLRFDDLRERGYPGEVIEEPRHVTKQDGEHYREFARRAGQHPIARQVKTRGLGGQYGRDAPEDSHSGRHRAPCEVPGGLTAD